MKNNFNKIYIDKFIITPQYSVNGNKTSFNFNSNIANKESMQIRSDQLSALVELSNGKKLKTIAEYYSSFFNTLNLESVVDYRKLLGYNKSKEYYQYIDSYFREYNSIITDYHTKIFPIRKRVYKNLENTLIDNEVLAIPVYQHSGTTGRTSIHEGTNFLTMKKEKRKRLKSIDPDKFLIEIDFKSCEPFFFFKTQCKDINIDTRDVYQWIANSFNLKIKDRDRFKRGILSMLYGANNSSVSSISGIKENKVVQIKEELGIKKFIQELEAEFAETDSHHIFNYYGRPILSGSNLFNYWIQSSTVDFCSLSFHQMIKDYNLTPCFFIHDCMVVSVNEEKYKEIKNIKSIGYEDIFIPIKINKIEE